MSYEEEDTCHMRRKIAYCQQYVCVYICMYMYVCMHVCMQQAMHTCSDRTFPATYLL
jgi:hypothetical protein